MIDSSQIYNKKGTNSKKNCCYSYNNEARNSGNPNFSISEESIINKFTLGTDEKLSNQSKTPTLVETRESDSLNTFIKKEAFSNEKNGRGNRTNFETEIDYSTEHLLNKIRNLENEKTYLLNLVEEKKNQELKYKKALETQAAIVNSENKKSQFYETEWLKMRSLEYSLINSGKSTLRQMIESYYEDPELFDKLGSFTNTQETFVANLIEDHKSLVKEKQVTTKKYYEAVDSNFQLYQQNEMLKAQNTILLEKNKDQINQEMEKKLNALNASLIYVQKENIELREILQQYSHLITNIKKCSEKEEIIKELEKFKHYLSA